MCTVDSEARWYSVGEDGKSMYSYVYNIFGTFVIFEYTQTKYSNIKEYIIDVIYSLLTLFKTIKAGNWI